MPGSFDDNGLWHWTDGQDKPVTVADLRAKNLAGGAFVIGNPVGIDTGVKAGIATITADGIRRIKLAPWRECDCICHKTGHRIIYPGGKKCCAPWPVCKKNIAGDLDLHQREAHNASRPVG